MENKKARNLTLVSFTKIVAYFSLFYSVVLLLMISMNLYYYLSNSNIGFTYLQKNNPYYVLLLGSALVSAVNFYIIKKEKYNWIVVTISIFLIGFTRINFEAIYQFFS